SNGSTGPLLTPTLPNLIEPQINYRCGIEREHLRNDQAADDRNPERLSQLAAHPHSDRPRPTPQHRSHRCHHDGPEPDKARLTNRFFRSEAFVSFGVQSKIDHHDG